MAEKTKLQVFKGALAAVKGAYDSLPPTSVSDDDYESASRRLKWVVKDLERIVKDAWVSQQALGAVENQNIALKIEEMPEPQGVISEAGAKFSKDSRAAIQSLADALSALIADAKVADDASEEDKAAAEAASTEIKSTVEEAISDLDALATDAENKAKEAKATKVASSIPESSLPESMDHGSVAVFVENAYVLSEAQGSKPDDAIFNMFVIAEGLSGNRVNYSAEKLKASAGLLNNRPIYVNHPQGIAEGKPQPRGIETKAGWWSEPTWVEGLQIKQRDGSIKVVNGITAKANILEHGPQPWVAPMLREAIAKGVPDLVGVSIVAGGNFEIKKGADGKLYREATEIAFYHSADLVAEPGAQGQALSRYESFHTHGDPELMDIETMTTEEFNKILELRPELIEGAGLAKKVAEAAPPPAPETKTAAENRSDNGDGSAKVTEIISEAKAATDGVNALLLEMRLNRSQELVRSLVSESRLPAKAREAITAEFAEQVADGDTIKARIEHYRNIAAEAVVAAGGHRGLTAGMIVPFGANVAEMSSPLDNCILALEDFFGIPDAEKAGKYTKIRSFTEFYRQVTGDYNVDGVFFKENSVIGDVWGQTFAEALPGATHIVGGATITMSNLLSATMNKALFNFYQEQPKWWKNIVQPETLNDMKTQTRIRLHNFGSLTERTVDGAEYTELDWSETVETYAPTEYGNVVTVGRRAIINDDLRGIRNIPRLLGWSATLTLNEYVSALFTVNSGNGPTLTDAVQVFNAASHQSNRDTNALNYTNLLAARKTTMAMLNDAGKRIGLEAKWLLVPIDLEADAFSLLKSVRVPGSANNDPNILADSTRGMRDFITVPNWTNATRWYTMCDPSQLTGIELGFLYGREEPEFFTQDNPTVGMVFTNDAMAFKVRHDYGGDWLDYRAATGHIPT